MNWITLARRERANLAAYFGRLEHFTTWTLNSAASVKELYR